MIGVVNRQVVLEQEETTKDIAAMIYQLVKGASMVDGKYSFVEKTVTNEFWDSFFQGNLIDNFEKIYLCFLVKIEFFMDNNYVNSSVYYFGEIVNHLLERTYSRLTQRAPRRPLPLQRLLHPSRQEQHRPLQVGLPQDFRALQSQGAEPGDAQVPEVPGEGPARDRRLRLTSNGSSSRRHSSTSWTCSTRPCRSSTKRS